MFQLRLLLYKLLGQLDGYKLYRDFIFIWKKQAAVPLTPHMKVHLVRCKWSKLQAGGEEQKGTMLGSPFSWPKWASALCAGTLGSTLEVVHWELNKGCS